ncbi:MAG: GH3 auxin-responsive promoter family protein [Bacteroidales bacterium]|nr:GH3 auxin-responsive promoter family protein [Candidatus Liminaster caballi]
MLTRIIYKIAFRKRTRQLRKYVTEPIELQEEQLSFLLRRGRRTSFGKNYGLSKDMTYEEFAKRVPLHTYDEIKPWIEQMLTGKRNILWPGLCRWFAKSSGTTSDKSKYIPVTSDCLHRTHYRGGTDVVAIYLNLNPASQMMDGKGLILGGSHAPAPLAPDLDIRVGDLSACLIQNVSPMVNAIRTPSKDIALMDEWEAKLKALTNATKDVNVTSLSGVPSWMMGLLKSVLEAKGAKDITEVWPNLEVFFHGGIAFTPYREQYKALIPSEKMHYLETYNASEGFFGIQSSFDDPALQLVIDNCTFYEFIPMDQFSDDTTSMNAIPLKDVEIGRNYAMVISTPGLWRYIVGDTIRFTQKNPYKFVITGRTKAFINAFGEELMVSNADQALAETCKEFGCEIAEYTAGPTFAADNSKAHHTWVIEFSKTPTDIEAFAESLDKALQRVNSDYEAKRYKGIFLSRLELISAPSGTFNQWLKDKGKLGGQHKIPRLSNSREYITELNNLINSTRQG